MSDLSTLAERNTSFSKKLPGMQLAIDSTSLGAFKTCARYYKYSIIDGYVGRVESPHLTFGILLHRIREGYEHARSAGLTHDEALDKVLDFVLRATWNKELKRPWISDHNLKNRKTLIQTTVWYLDDKAKNDTLETLQLANGKPAVELSFRFDSGFRTRRDEETILLCGHLDRIVKLGIHNYIADIKTSGNAVDGKWAKQFSPHNQFSMYALAGKIAFGFEIEGVIVDGVQIGVTFSRANRHFVPRSAAQLEEWLHGVQYNVELMELAATRQDWPMNETSCDKYGGCPFREICSRSPISRQQWLDAGFVKRTWDPLQIRGDV